MIYRELLSDIDENMHIENSPKSQKCQPCLIVEPYQPPDQEARLAMFDNNSWGVRHRICRSASWKNGRPTIELKSYFAMVVSCRKM